jgi:hypothetical protein
MAPLLNKGKPDFQTQRMFRVEIEIHASRMNQKTCNRG